MADDFFAGAFFQPLRAFDGCENLKDVYYAGTEKQAAEISIFLGNDCYTHADIHIGSTEPTGIYEGQYTRTGTFNNGLMEYEFTEQAK